MFGKKKKYYLGKLSDDDILNMRRDNRIYRGVESGNVFPKEEVRRARQGRKQRSKHSNFENMDWF